MEVKVCGVRDVASAEACATAGADFAGLNFVTGRRRAITVQAAGPLMRSLGAVEPVGVFLDQSFDRVLDVAETLGLRWVQLHGQEPPEMCGALQRRGLRVIKALGVGRTFDASTLGAYRMCDRLLLDAPAPGSGRRIEQGLLDAVQVPFLLAGGLTPENVAEAVTAARPAGVDTASGVEVDGRPDPARVHAFCRAARAASMEVR